MPQLVTNDEARLFGGLVVSAADQARLALLIESAETILSQRWPLASIPHNLLVVAVGTMVKETWESTRGASSQSDAAGPFRQDVTFSAYRDRMQVPQFIVDMLNGAAGVGQAVVRTDWAV